MPAYKDKKTNKWYAKFNYKNWNEKGMEKIMNDIIPNKIKLNLEYVNSDSEEDDIDPELDNIITKINAKLLIFYIRQ